VFNLVKYRYLFLLISLIVIIPGAISLAIFHLDLGLDFTGGSSIELHPQVPVQNSAQVEAWLKPLHLQELSVTFGQDPSLASGKSAWILLNTPIDSNVQASITSTLQGKYPGVHVRVFDLSHSSFVVVDGFKTAPTASDLQTLLSKIPDTSNPALGPATTPTPTATATPAATATAKATATATTTATPTATATPKATATATPKATATATSGSSSNSGSSGSSTTSNPANIPVSVQKVLLGTTNQTITILTRTPIGGKSSDIPDLLQTILNQGGPYMGLVANQEVGPSVASDTTRNAVLAVIAASVFILLYIWFAFRKVARPWRYGACAIIALLHDVLVVLGVFSILGKLFQVQVDALFITALLTVVGFSVHDTIVVFDRIRENMQRRTVESFEQVVNASLVQTMARSLNTSLTVLFTLSALTLFGGDSIRTFTLALLIGIFSGTYSSIFNASMLLVMWEKREWIFGWLSRNRDEGRRPARELVGTR
jgi:preprotein translocase SecF subunit